jgi:hypothetical protein
MPQKDMITLRQDRMFGMHPTLLLLTEEIVSTHLIKAIQTLYQNEKISISYPTGEI